jgi:hypothetical protein
MAIIMRTIDIVLAVSHRPLNWAGAALNSDLHWPGAVMREAYVQVDELIYSRPKRERQSEVWIVGYMGMSWRIEAELGLRGWMAEVKPSFVR